MSRHFELNPLLRSKSRKQPLQLYCADVQIEIKKCTLVGSFSITKFGRPSKPMAKNSPAPARAKNRSVKKQRAQGGYVKKHTKVKAPKMNWTTPDDFRLLKVAVEESLCADKGQKTMCTDMNLLERTLGIIVPTLSGLFKRNVKFDDITVGMVYPIQYGNHNLLSISYKDFLKDIIIEKYNSNDGMKCPEVIRIIVKNGTM